MTLKLISGFSGLMLIGLLSLAPAHALEPKPHLKSKPRYVVPIQRFAKVTPFLYRGARPTQDGIGVLKTLGVKTILNIENDVKAVDTERAWAQALDIQYISIPLSGFFAPSEGKMDQIFKVLHDPSNYPVFLHCKHGEDRTGLVVGLYRYYDEHWAAQAAYDEMLQNGFHKALFGLNFYFKEKTGLKDDLLLLGDLQ
jgi:protein tyrosine/serine phosphatase